MKFLCVACDEPMKLEKTEKPQENTLTALFECPECFTQIAMLTNPSETQMVQSLGVKIGPAVAEGEGEAAAKCPFAGMLGGIEVAKPPEVTKPAEVGSASDGVQWTAEALSRLDNIPDFVRPMAKQGIEHFAQSNGCPVINEAVLEEARGKFGM